ncbi:hypothetical protein J2S47_003554 [Streptomyces griseoviridis]|uniref:Uncharacterized protein n=1 Tax=Streptomyces griseoviridis TaxID=45398 RepID=A0ABT9LH62_STRGD|nr:hypothetical protein [Streptomyces griseoviridis]
MKAGLASASWWQRMTVPPPVSVSAGSGPRKRGLMTTWPPSDEAVDDEGVAVELEAPGFGGRRGAGDRPAAGVLVEAAGPADRLAGRLADPADALRRLQPAGARRGLGQDGAERLPGVGEAGGGEGCLGGRDDGGGGGLGGADREQVVDPPAVGGQAEEVPGDGPVAGSAARPGARGPAGRGGRVGDRGAGALPGRCRPGAGAAHRGDGRGAGGEEDLARKGTALRVGSRASSWRSRRGTWRPSGSGSIRSGTTACGAQPRAAVSAPRPSRARNGRRPAPVTARAGGAAGRGSSPTISTRTVAGRAAERSRAAGILVGLSRDAGSTLWSNRGAGCGIRLSGPSG